jgi:hypothetical protein
VISLLNCNFAHAQVLSRNEFTVRSYEYCASKHWILYWIQENKTATYFLRSRLFTYDTYTVTSFGKAFAHVRNSLLKKNTWHKPQALVSFKKYMTPPLPYFKVNIYPFPLPHFASICLKIKQRRISFVLGYLRMILKYFNCN